MEELNKKLAEWRGLVLAEEPDYTGFYLFADADGICHTANFTQSLDACFKWLVPKLIYAEIWGEKSFRGEVWEYFARVEVKGIELVSANAETPALALCLAIEKLIDGDKEV